MVIFTGDGVVYNYYLVSPNGKLVITSSLCHADSGKQVVNRIVTQKLNRLEANTLWVY